MNSQTKAPFAAIPVELNNYYPFGLPEAGRSWSYQGVVGETNHYNDYTYGFNGMQRDNSKGIGSGYTTLFREYDPEIARWKSLDPKLKDFPSESPFSAMGNNPIMNTDVLGDWAWVANVDKVATNGRTTPYQYKHLNPSNYAMNTYQGYYGSYTSMNSKQVESATALINANYSKWINVAPKVAGYLMNTDFPIAVVDDFKKFKSLDNDGNIVYSNLLGMSVNDNSNILINHSILYTMQQSMTVMHEILHKLGEKEFGARAGVYAVYKNMDNFISTYRNIEKSNWNYLSNGMPNDIRKLYIADSEGNYSLPKENEDQFKILSREIGQKAVGSYQEATVTGAKDKKQ